MRRPAVAGQFYPADPDELRSQIDSFLRDLKLEKKDCIAAVVPHAGYIYSGWVAAHVYAAIKPRSRFVIIGPNHTGLGSAIAVSSQPWSTPLGSLEIDEQLLERIPKQIIDLDETAHRYEHSIEVQLPFLQRIFGSPKILPICLGLQDEETAAELGEQLSQALAGMEDFMLIASSDFTHYEPDSVAREKDMHLIQAILDLDPREFYSRLRKRQISACGYGCIAAVMHASRNLGAKRAELLKYATSADVTGDASSVVGYAGIIIY